MFGGISKYVASMLVSHTFSIPKNLSLPSFRIGPAFINILSKGVWLDCAAASFLDGEAPIEGLVGLFLIPLSAVFAIVAGRCRKHRLGLPTHRAAFQFTEEGSHGCGEGLRKRMRGTGTHCWRESCAEGKGKTAAATILTMQRGWRQKS